MWLGGGSLLFQLVGLRPRLCTFGKGRHALRLRRPDRLEADMAFALCQVTVSKV